MSPDHEIDPGQATPNIEPPHPRHSVCQEKAMQGQTTPTTACTKTLTTGRATSPEAPCLSRKSQLRSAHEATSKPQANAPRHAKSYKFAIVKSCSIPNYDCNVLHRRTSDSSNIRALLQSPGQAREFNKEAKPFCTFNASVEATD